MKSNKKIIALLIAIVVIVAVAFSVSSAFGYDLVRMLPFISTPDATVPENQMQPDCDLTATTTPCSELEVTQEAAAPVESATKKQPISYGPLTETYTDEQYGFSFMYPKELEVSKEGDVILRDSSNSKKYAVKICTPNTPCGVGYSEITSLKDFEKERTSLAGESSKYGIITFKEIPKYSVYITLENGVNLLKQITSPALFDAKGNDITEKECEECVGDTLKYHLFVNGSGLTMWHISGDVSVTEKILNSLKF